MMTASPSQRRAAPRRPSVLLAYGFRPFFLLAGLSATLSIPLWLLVQQGHWDVRSHLGPTAWHGHEMLFGFAAAVIAGFLLTAGSNWTGRPTARGALLGGLVLVWLAGRLALLAGGLLPTGLVIAVDVGFLPLLGLVLLRALWAGANRRNLVFPLLLLALGALNLWVHLAALGLGDRSASDTLWVAVDVITVMLVVMGGRVIPAFTRNALPQAKVVVTPWLDVPAIALVAAVLLLDAVFGPGWQGGVAALLAGLANLLRVAAWDGLAARRQPLLWVLHLGYLWVAVGLLLRGLATVVPALPGDAALHALTAGAIGTMTLGMMSRVALGHTGRRLAVSPAVTLGYALVLAAALARVAAAFAAGSAYDALLLISGASWTVGFAIFTVVYLPILARPRVDGRPG